MNEVAVGIGRKDRPKPSVGILDEKMLLTISRQESECPEDNRVLVSHGYVL